MRQMGLKAMQQAEQAVEHWLAELTSSSARARLHAAEKLVQYYQRQPDQRVVEALLACLENRDPVQTEVLDYEGWDWIENHDVLSAVASALGTIADQHTRGRLIALFQEQGTATRPYLAAALGVFGALDPLIAALQEEDFALIAASARALAQTGDRRAVVPLIQALGQLLPRHMAYVSHAQATGNPELQNAPTVLEIPPTSGAIGTIIAALGTLGDKRAVEPLIDVLRVVVQPEYVEQSRSFVSNLIEVLAAFRDQRAIEPLISCLHPSRLYVRREAVEALVRLGATQAVEPLIACLQDEGTLYRSEVARALGNLGATQAVGPLVICLRDAFPTTRRAAAGALGNLGAEQAFEPLLACLHDADGTVRGAAAEALVKLEPRRAIEPLLACLHDADDAVRSYAMEELGKQKATQAIVPLIALVREHRGHEYKVVPVLTEIGAIEPLLVYLHDADSHVRYAAAEALVKQGAPVIEPLITCLQDQHIQTRITAAEALGKLGATEAIEPLIACLQDQEILVSVTALEALGQLRRTTEVVEPLITRLQDAESLLRCNAAWALGELEAREAIEQLIACLQDAESSVRCNAAWALGKLKAREAIEPLLAYSQQPDPYGSLNCEVALGRLQVRQAPESLIPYFQDENLYRQFKAWAEEDRLSVTVPLWTRALISTWGTAVYKNLKSRERSTGPQGSQVDALLLELLLGNGLQLRDWFHFLVAQRSTGEDTHGE